MKAQLDEERYLLWERAAIIEFDGAAPREVAEFEAIRQVLGTEALHCGIRTFAQYETSRL